MSINRADVSTYTTFCETHHQIPVIQISDLHVSIIGKERPFYIKIDTVVMSKDGKAHDGEANVYWKNDQPAYGSLLYGVMTIGVNTAGMAFYFNNLDVEVRPGDVADGNYRPRHISRVPMQIRAVGKIIRKEGTVVTIEVETYIGTGKSKFHIRFNVPAHLMEKVPPVGGYAGGRGPLLSVLPVSKPADSGTFNSHRTDPKVPAAGLDVEMEQLYVGTMRQANVKDEAGKREWIKSLTEEGTTSSVAAAPKLAGPTNVNSLTTFCEAYHRFMIVTVTDTTSKLVIVRTVGTNGTACDFNMTWPQDEIPPLRTVFGMIANISVDNGINVMVPVPSTVDVRPGHPDDDNYRKDQILRGPCRLRAGGRVVYSTRTELVLVGCIEVHGKEMPFQTTFLIPERDGNKNDRWSRYTAVALGQFVSASGTLASISSGSNSMITVDIVQLTNAPVGQFVASTTAAGVSTSKNISLSAWDAPSSTPTTPSGTWKNGWDAASGSSGTAPGPSTAGGSISRILSQQDEGGQTPTSTDGGVAPLPQAGTADSTAQTQSTVDVGDQQTGDDAADQSLNLSRADGKKRAGVYSDKGRAAKVSRS
ncbi:hypothetical protein A4X13_0g3982 [Tilletia indica]|uniref:Uncharacterized protein n=1 Tax=Tilletia indica TaxID=43049 RepID=A0A177TE52_9BASI|nr:hypothetical protein A4X13_0g3982 [Tilletia indica]